MQLMKGVTSMIIMLYSDQNKPLSYHPNNFYDIEKDLDEILTF